jgi:DNA anti-recombination protein RmuC
MAARKTTTRKRAAKKKTVKKATRAKKAGHSVRARLEAELPTSLAEFVRQVTTRLNRLEKQLDKAEGRYRREWTHTLKNVSRQLGRFEAAGEKRWKKLTDSPRRDAVRLLRKLEKAIEPRKGRTTKRKKAPARRATPGRA